MKSSDFATLLTSEKSCWLFPIDTNLLDWCLLPNYVEYRIRIPNCKVLALALGAIFFWLRHI
jgi:hypothetical protein